MAEEKATKAVGVEPLVRRTDETEKPKLDKYLLRISKVIGWKSVYFYVISFQRRHYPDSGYNFNKL